MMEFLYFPEDKTAYIPAVLNLLIFVALAALAMYIFIKVSRKQEEKAAKQYDSSTTYAEDKQAENNNPK
ncbi:hypothetical protein [Thalassobacillus pellis]|uniref:hypothetical protein n=1 Tax=Thalassobacillus pellis TaxID=748008 RepID=UPI001961FBC2|nr:hypothetical protein [Thalassobacillus pellis]MBM7554862.1 flagellar biosynthesis/type III secretory pathway M-ring protein FliF/YscJ [Thalassobacillus pellis]